MNHLECIYHCAINDFFISRVLKLRIDNDQKELIIYHTIN